MRCRPRPPPPSTRRHTRGAVHPPLFYYYFAFESFRFIGTRPNQTSRARESQTTWRESARERGKERERERERAFKSGGLSPIFIIHSSLNLFRFLPRFPRTVTRPRTINLPSVVSNEFNRVSKTMWVNATATVLFLAREHDLSCVFISISVAIHAALQIIRAIMSAPLLRAADSMMLEFFGLAAWMGIPVRFARDIAPPLYHVPDFANYKSRGERSANISWIKGRASSVGICRRTKFYVFRSFERISFV